MSAKPNHEQPVFIEPGILAIYGPVPDTQAHSHDLIQITLPTDTASMLITHDGVSKTLTDPHILNRHISHQLTMKCGWVILIEPSSGYGEHLLSQLGEDPFIPLTCSLPNANTLTLSSLLSACGVTARSDHTGLDTRIASLLEKLNSCIGHECVKPQQWRAAEIAAELNLSESRFLHLFKDTMHIPWRPYLLWRRLICAIQMLKTGKSATEAAYIAGFSDSAHLSRTFKKQFGITLNSYKQVSTR